MSENAGKFAGLFHDVVMQELAGRETSEQHRQAVSHAVAQKMDHRTQFGPMHGLLLDLARGDCKTIAKVRQCAERILGEMDVPEAA